MEVSLDSQNVEGLAMGADCSPPSRQAWGSRTTGGRQPGLPRSRALDRPHGCTLARSSRPVRALEFCLPALLPLDLCRGYLRVSSRPYPVTWISNTRSSTARSSGPTNMASRLEIRPLAGREVA